MVVAHEEVDIKLMVSQETESGVTARKNSPEDSSSSNPSAPTQDHPTAFEKVGRKCIRCLEPGHPWGQCKARIIADAGQSFGGGDQGQNNGGEVVCCLAKCMLGMNVTRVMRNITIA